MKIGDRIREQRKMRGFTLDDIAKATGVSKQTVQKYETGVIANIPSDKIESIALALGTSPAYLMGWEPAAGQMAFPSPAVTDKVVTFPVIGSVAAGYNEIAMEDWSGDTVEIPLSYLHGRPQSDYFVLSVHGESMYPLYIDGDKVLVLKCDTLSYSGEIGVILYGGDNATLKRVEYVDGEDWLKLIPVNPAYPPKKITGADLEQCRVLGVPRLLIRGIEA